MAYQVEASDLSEKVKRDVAVIASPVQLDEKTWAGLSATPGIAGHLEFHGLIDTAVTQPSKEISLIVGWNIVVYTGAGETAGVAMGSIRDYWEVAYYISEGAWVAISSDTMLEPDMLIIVAVNQDCILEGDWAATYTEADLPVAIPCGHAVLATVLYYNDDPYAEHILKCTVEFYDPDGVTISSATLAAVLSPGEYAMGWNDFTNLVTLDKPGTWKVHAVLSD